MSNVFISYSSIDRPFVLRLADDLQRAGHSIWLDQWKITGRHPYWDEIQMGLEYCTHFIFVISPESIDRESGARRELYHVGSLKPVPVIVPVMVRETPYSRLPMLISPGQYQIHDFVRQTYTTALTNVIVALSQDANAQGMSSSAAMHPPMPIQSAAQQAPRPFNYAVPTKSTRNRSMTRIVLISGLLVSAILAGLALFLIYLLSPKPATRAQLALGPTTPAPGLISPTFSISGAELTSSKLPTMRFVTMTPFLTVSIPQLPTNTAIVIVPRTSTSLPTSNVSTGTGASASAVKACSNSKYPWQFTNGDIAMATTDLPLYSDPATDQKSPIATIPKGTVFQINYGAVCYTTYTLWNIYFKDKNINGWSPESEMSKGYFMKPYNGNAFG